MPGINHGRRRRKHALNKGKNFILKYANIVNSFSRFLIGYIKKDHIKELTVLQLKVELESLKFYQFILLLMIKISQSERDKLL